MVSKKQNDTSARYSLAGCGIATFCLPEIGNGSPALVIVLLLIPNKQLCSEATCLQIPGPRVEQI